MLYVTLLYSLCLYYAILCARNANDASAGRVDCAAFLCLHEAAPWLITDSSMGCPPLNAREPLTGSFKGRFLLG